MVPEGRLFVLSTAGVGLGVRVADTEEDISIGIIETVADDPANETLDLVNDSLRVLGEIARRLPLISVVNVGLYFLSW